MSYSVLDNAFGERAGPPHLTLPPPPPSVIATGAAQLGPLAWPETRRNTYGSVFADPTTACNGPLLTYPQLLAYMLYKTMQ
jgi:hypothetical protein